MVKLLMHKKITDITDEEIIEAIASFGVIGAGTWGVLARLGCGLTGSNESALLHRVQVSGRVIATNGGTMYLDPDEWSKRLENKSAEDVSRIMRGRQ